MRAKFKIKFHYPPPINLCRSCKYAYGDVRRGIMCGLTRNKPDFYAFCPYFSLSKARDQAVHSHDNAQAQSRVKLLEFWTMMLVFIVLLSPLLDILGGSFSVYFIVILGLLGFSIYTFLTSKLTDNLPAFAFLYVVYAWLILAKKDRITDEKTIVYQTLVRLFGHQVAQKAMSIEQIPETDKLKWIIRRISYHDRRFLFSLLCQLFVYKNLQNCDRDQVMRTIAKSLGISDDEYFRFKQIYMSKEADYQQRQQQNKYHYSASSQRSSDYYYKILGISPSATDKEIKARFRYLAMKYHPDRQPNEQAARQAGEQFRIILQAYEQIKKMRGMV